MPRPPTPTLRRATTAGSKQDARYRISGVCAGAAFGLPLFRAPDPGPVCVALHNGRMGNGIRMVAFDGDDTLWRSQDYFDDAQARFEQIVGAYVDLADARVAERLYAFEKANLAWFGYGVKGMALSMIEAAVEITGQRIGAADVQRIVGMAKELLRHPVELLPGIREAVAGIAARHDVVLITKGDLFHQEQKAAPCTRHAKARNTLKIMESARNRRPAKRRRCNQMEPDGVRSCPSFAPIRGAA